MPIVIGIFFFLPMGLALMGEYLCCRLPRRRIWRALPPLLAVIFVLAALWVRLENWQSEEVSPLTQLILFPGVPGTALCVGCWLGWRLWKRLWTPRVIDDV